MITAKASYSPPPPPVIESVTLTLSAEEAKKFIRFLGQTSSKTVQELLPDLDSREQTDINQILFNVFENIKEALESDGSWEYWEYAYEY